MIVSVRGVAVSGRNTSPSLDSRLDRIRLITSISLPNSQIDTETLERSDLTTQHNLSNKLASQKSRLPQRL